MEIENKAPAGPELDAEVARLLFNGQAERPYSTDLVASMAVVESLKRDLPIGCWFAIEITRGNIVRAGVADHDTHNVSNGWLYLGVGPSVPLAICRAAIAKTRTA